jgi:enolase
VLPVPMVNLFSGGLHAGKGMDIQDFLVVPLCADTYPEALEIIWRLREAASELLGRRGMTTLLADEGGLSPGFPSAEDALQATVETIELAGLVPGRDAGIALDLAATGLWHADDGVYHFTRAQRQLSGGDITTMLEGWIRAYPIVSIEDPLHDEDWAAWSTLTARLPGVQIVGDDLFATNAARIQRGVREGAGTCALIKVNQNGTLSGTLEALRTAQDGRFSTVVSARSGETEDAFIADLAVGTGCGQIKIGSLRSSERLSKYNQLSRLSELVGPRLAPDSLQRLRAAGTKTAAI